MIGTDVPYPAQNNPPNNDIYNVIYTHEYLILEILNYFD